MRVLVIDDSAPVRARVASLVAENAEVEGIDEAPDGAHGIALARAAAPDLVILDLQLPGLSGLDVLPALKAGPAPPVVVVLTNQATAHYRHECLARGADYFFDKSREFDRIAEVVRAWARRPSSTGL
jgi:DNA-binding NarL/FixJ family response regulator